MMQARSFAGNVLCVLSILMLVATQWVTAPAAHAGVKPQIGAARHNGMALKSDGTVWSWGDSLFGALGRGCTDSVSAALVPVDDLLLGRKHATGDDLVIDFEIGNELWMWLNNITWQQLHGVPAKLVATADMDFDGRDEVVVDFGSSYGVWIWMNNSNWVPQTQLEQLATTANPSMLCGNREQR